MKLFFV